MATNNPIETGVIHTGDSMDVLDDLAENSVHAVVTDPPYGLAFMGRSWDDFEPKEYQDFCERWASKALRVLKPGGHLLAFSGNRTHHRLFSGVEDAGFEVRDTVTWHYGSGFPKALDVSKAIDEQADAERWDGWKTTLKPATEFVVVARAPLSEGTVAENVQTHGTGALNIDGTRVDTNEEWSGTDLPDADSGVSLKGSESGELNEQTSGSHPEGRYPSNVVFNEEVADETAERYFYTSKATRAERTLDGKIDNAHPTVKPADLMEWLVRLVTAEGQTVLDPFAGSGTTCRAAKDLGRAFVGIEKDPKWADVARVRCGMAAADPSNVRSQGVVGLDDFA